MDPSLKFDIAYLFIGCSAAMVALTWRSGVHRAAVTAMIFWQLLGMVVYQRNEVEIAGRLAAIAVYVVLCESLFKVYGRMLFRRLGQIGLGAAAWVTLYGSIGGDPYWFKAGLNLLWLAGLILISLSIRARLNRRTCLVSLADRARKQPSERTHRSQ